MVRKIEVEEFVELSRSIPVLDVRSPKEFKQGHIPNAISYPLFDDAERAEVGTLYKQLGQQQAIERGIEIVSGKMNTMFMKGVSYAKDKKLLVHCWRGGKRSESVAGLLAVSGIDVFVLKGGYKAYRNWVLRQFESPIHFNVLGGLTGIGKTRMLYRLEELGEAILDIEGLAAHRGSAFGRLGQGKYVSPQLFENTMAEKLALLKGRKIWIEDESRVLGGLIIPTKIWEKKIEAPLYFVSIPDSARVEMLLADYGDFSHADLKKSILKIQKRLGGLRTKQALDALANNESLELVRLLLDYYDQLYMDSKKSRDQVTFYRLAFQQFDLDQICAELISQARSHGN